MYNLQPAKGGWILAYILLCAVGWFPLTLILAMLGIHALIFLLPFLWITGPIVYFVQFIDAVMIASKLNRGEPVRPFEWL